LCRESEGLDFTVGSEITTKNEKEIRTQKHDLQQLSCKKVFLVLNENNALVIS